MDFVNRKNDFINVENSIQTNDITYLLAGRAVGISSFLEELEMRLEFYQVFRCNAAIDNNLFSLLLNCINRSDFNKNFIDYIRNELGEYKSRTISSVLHGIPYLGDLLANISDGKEIPQVYAGCFSSAFDEIIIPYITQLSLTNKIVILIDSAEQLNEISYNLIANLAQIEYVQIVLAITEVQSIDFIKLRNALSLYSNCKINTVLFEEPGNTLIKELASYFEYEISDDIVSDILISSRNNIHLIIDYFINLKFNTKFNINEINKSIIFVLSICKFGLDTQTIIEILKDSNVFIGSLTDILDNIEELETLKFITKNIINSKEIYTINSISNPTILGLLSSYSDELYYKNLIYNYFDSKILIVENINILELMYDLSIQFKYTRVRKYAKLILAFKLKSGDIINPTIVTNSELDNSNVEDTILAILYYTRERYYSDALKWLEANKSVSNKPVFKHLEGILNNRVRNFVKANNILEQSIKTENDTYKLNIILAFYTANCIHSNKPNLAINEYYSKKSHLKNSENWGYFLRNLASALPFEEKIKMLNNAIDNFALFNDQYGIYSSKCNLGIVYCNSGFPEKGIKLLKEAEKGLQKNGSNHLHIIYNDLGVCYLMLKDVENANKYLQLAKLLARNKMPTIITSINLACLIAVDNTERAIELLNSIEQDVIKHPVDNVRKKYFYNRLLVESMSDINTAIQFFNSNKTTIEKYVDDNTIDFYLNTLFKNNKLIDYKSDYWDTLYKCSGLVYWYVDPLKLI